ncbi:MAG: DUF2244 domain-containing protein [Pseudomonadota bacterium]
MTDRPSPPSTTSLVISGNNSLTARDSLLFYGSVLGMTTLISGGWALLGYWPVLPFAGFELALLGSALFLMHRRASYRELVVISPQEVRLERGRPRDREVLEWPSPWTRVELAAASAPGSRRRSQLLIVSSGKRTEIAAMITEQERRALHKRLRELLAQARSEAATTTLGPDEVIPAKESTNC